MPTDRWQEILDAPVNPDGNWVVLPENGWGAVIAYAAGPGHARPHDVPLSERRVTVTVHDTGRVFDEPFRPADLADIAEMISDYLVTVGLPVSPRTWWEVDLPPGMSEADLDRPFDGADVSAGLVGEAAVRAEAQALGAAVRHWYEDT